MGKLKEPTQNEQTEFSQYNIEDLLLGMVSSFFVNRCRELSSETQRKWLAAGSPLKPTTTKNSILVCPKPGSAHRALWAVHVKASALRVSGRTRTVSATGVSFVF